MTRGVRTEKKNKETSFVYLTRKTPPTSGVKKLSTPLQGLVFGLFKPTNCPTFGLRKPTTSLSVLFFMCLTLICW